MSDPAFRPDPAAESLRIALLTYRGKPHVGGQGVYVRNLSRALCDQGHQVEVFSGQPYPELDPRVPLHKLPSLDIFNDHFPGRMPGLWEIRTWPDLAELASFMTGSFAEPLAFSLRAYQALKPRAAEFDIVQDNQCLGYGLLSVENSGLPVLGTIHHPITVDRRLEISHASRLIDRFGKSRWYAFTAMQTKVAQRLQRILTVSRSSRDDICRDHKINSQKLVVVPVGVDLEVFKPMPELSRQPGQIVTTTSSDVAMKGLRYLLEAVAKLRSERDVSLCVIGQPKPGGTVAKTIQDLAIGDIVTFISGVPEQTIVELYANSQVAVVPSLYEGFSLPAIEAMATATPLVTTTGGALPEVVGRHQETALLVEPGNAEALAHTIRETMDSPELAARIGAAGRERVASRWSWQHTAQGTLEQYRTLLDNWQQPRHNLPATWLGM